MKKTIAIIILIIICLGLGGYIAYDKLYAEKEVEKEPATEKELKITVEDGLVIKSEKEYTEGVNEMVDVTLPKVLVNGKESKTVKDKLEAGTKDAIYAKLKELEDYSLEWLKGYEEGTVKIYGVSAKASYKYLVKDNVVLLLIDSKYSPGLPKGGFYGNVVDKIIFYDAKKDKLLTLEEGFKAFGYTIDEFNEIINETIDKYCDGVYENIDTCKANYNESVATVGDTTVEKIFSHDNGCGMSIDIENNSLKFDYSFQCE